MDEYKKCRHCGNNVPQYSHVCPDCGRKMRSKLGGDSFERLLNVFGILFIYAGIKLLNAPYSLLSAVFGISLMPITYTLFEKLSRSDTDFSVLKRLLPTLLLIASLAMVLSAKDTNFYRTLEADNFPSEAEVGELLCYPDWMSEGDCLRMEKKSFGKTDYLLTLTVPEDKDGSDCLDVGEAIAVKLSADDEEVLRSIRSLTIEFYLEPFGERYDDAEYVVKLPRIASAYSDDRGEYLNELISSLEFVQRSDAESEYPSEETAELMVYDDWMNESGCLYYNDISGGRFDFTLCLTIPEGADAADCAAVAEALAEKISYGSEEAVSSISSFMIWFFANDSVPRELNNAMYEAYFPLIGDIYTDDPEVFREEMLTNMSFFSVQE